MAVGGILPIAYEITNSSYVRDALTPYNLPPAFWLVFAITGAISLMAHGWSGDEHA